MKMMKILIAFALLALAAPVHAAQNGDDGDGAEPTIADVPFGIGERLEYRVKFGPLRVGEASMSIEEIDTVAGHPTYHIRSVIEGATPFYKLVDKQESWLDVRLLASRRFLQDSQQGSYERYRLIDFDLENRVYRTDEGQTDSIPANALDEASFIYFARTVPLEVGERYEWNRYFKFDRNPVVLQVLRRETVKVPAGEYETIVVRPIIKTGGIFSEGGEAEIYITDDERRIPVMMKSKLKVGSLTLEMTDYAAGVKLTGEALSGE